MHKHGHQHLHVLCFLIVVFMLEDFRNPWHVFALIRENTPVYCVLARREREREGEKMIMMMKCSFKMFAMWIHLSTAMVDHSYCNLQVLRYLVLQNIMFRALLDV